MTAWVAFESALTSRGLSFSHVAQATDTRAVIQAAGFTDAIDIAVIETVWASKRAASAVGGASPGAAAPYASSPPPNHRGGHAADATAAVSIGTFAVPLVASSSYASMPNELADTVIADECFHAMLGFSGAFITLRVGQVGGGHSLVRLQFAQEVPVAIRNAIDPVVGPIASALLSLQASALAECGWRSVVNMAVGEVLREICCTYKRDLKLLAENLAGRHKPLSLVLSQGMQLAYPVLRLAQVFEGDSDPAKGKYLGAKMLDHLYEQYTRSMGSQEDVDLLGLVLRRAAAPYLEMLRKWVLFGQLCDPHGEFFVREADINHTGTDDPRIRWEQRFQKKKSEVPAFLRKENLDVVVLTSGKLCLTLRECGAVVPGDQTSDASALAASAVPSAQQHAPYLSASTTSSWIWTDATELITSIHRAHEAASQAMQHVLVGRFHLIERLVGLKHYFLHDRGDWLSGFLDAAGELLHRAPSQVKAYTLNLILQAEVAKACVKEDPFHADVGCSLSETTLLAVAASAQTASEIAIAAVGSTRSSGRLSLPVGTSTDARRAVDHVQLTYSCPWPLPIVIHPLFISQLNIIFRLLLRLKITERSLHLTLRKSNYESMFYAKNGVLIPIFQRVPALIAKTAMLRHLLLQFVTQFQFHAMHAVIEPHWAAFIGTVTSSYSLRDISDAKAKFIEAVFQGLAVSNKNRIRCLALIIDLALKFCVVCHRQRQLFENMAAAANNNTASSFQKAAAPPPPAATAAADWDAKVTQTDDAVTHIQADFLRLLGDLARPEDKDYSAFLPFLVTLDFNGFYEKSGVYRVRPSVAAEVEFTNMGGPAASSIHRSASTASISSAVGGGGSTEFVDVS